MALFMAVNDPRLINTKITAAKLYAASDLQVVGEESAATTQIGVASLRFKLVELGANQYRFELVGVGTSTPFNETTEHVMWGSCWSSFKPPGH